MRNLLLKSEMFLVGAINEHPWDSDIPAVASGFVEQLKSVTKTLAIIFFSIIATLGLLYLMLLGVQKALAKDPDKNRVANERLIGVMKGVGYGALGALFLPVILGIVYGILISKA